MIQQESRLKVADNTGAVSYTHLDVYKRQTLERFYLRSLLFRQSVLCLLHRKLQMRRLDRVTSELRLFIFTSYSQRFRVEE